MPVMDGFAATQAIRTMDKGKSIVIVAVSASVSEDTRLRIQARGFNDFIAKPLSFCELFEKIYRSLDIHGDDLPDSVSSSAELSSELARMRHDQIVSSIELGDLEGLEKQAEEWKRQPALIHYSEQIIKNCQEINIEQLEAIKMELSGFQ